MEKKHILFIMPFLPYPMKSGGHQALYNGIAAIQDSYNVSIAYMAIDDAENHWAEKEFLTKFPEVTLFPFKEPEWIPPTISQRIGLKLHLLVDKVCGRIQTPIIPKGEEILNWWRHTITPSHRAWLQYLHDILQQNHFDLIQVEMPERISDVLVLPEDTKRVYVHHELGFVRRELEVNQFSDCRPYADAVLRFVDSNEIDLLNHYDAVVTLSSVDTVKLKGKGVSKPIYSSFAIIDATTLVQPEVGDGHRLTFVGPEVHSPNLVGLTWFLENCWSRLRHLDPIITLDIIGKWTEGRKKEYSTKYPGIKFLGFVSDLNASIQASTMIVPITIGSGIRMKILEAASNGVPFVSTTVGAEGIPVTDGKDCFLTNDAEEFVQSIIKLQDCALRQTFIENAHKMVTENYSLDALRKNRHRIYNEILATGIGSS